MKQAVRICIAVLSCLLAGSSAFSQPIEPSEPAILPLRPAAEFIPNQVIPSSVRYLSDGKAVESYLIAMDGAPPRWEAIAGPEGVGEEEALMKLNTKRDRVRKTRRLVKQRLAFLWSGKLLDYKEARGGFTLSIGPERFNTSWGEVFIRPDVMPLFLIAVPPADLKEDLQSRLKSGEAVEVHLLMQGRLKTIIYGFSHEHRGVGAVIPRIVVDDIQFFLVSDTN